jgi:NAD(P)H-hydrate epimerase
MTVTFGYPKLGQVVYPGLSYVGELVVADIGISPEATAEICPNKEVLEEQDISWLVPMRDRDSHKGTYGHLLVLAGSRGKTGAAALACRAAMRVGTGLVTLAGARSLSDIYAAALLEVMTEPLADGPDEQTEPLSDQQWERLLARKSAVLFGPGIGVHASCQSTLSWLLTHLEVPWVIDADGLNNLAGEIHRLKRARTAPVLTPHPGEMARLIGQDTATVNQNRVEVARGFAQDHRCHVVLKGARTVIASPTGRVAINPTGNPGLASGGTGDVLAGILAGLLAQGFTVEDAVRLGVFLHGFAGDMVAAQKGEIGMIASDIVEMLPAALRGLSERRAEQADFKLPTKRIKLTNRRSNRTP